MIKEKNNNRIRTALHEADMTFWQLAVILGKSEPTITRMMRIELPEAEQNRIIELIQGAKETR